MFPAPFEYHDPTTVPEVLRLLGEHGPDAKVLAGGQSLVAAMNLGLVRPPLVVDLHRVAGLEYVRTEAGALVLGALARHRSLEGSAVVRAACPLLAEAAALIGNARVRSRGTLGGSLAHADPSAELPTAMLALEAEFRLAGPGGGRSVSAGEFFLAALTTALRHDELLVEVRVPLHRARTGWAFEEFGCRRGDWAVAGVAALVTLDDDGSCEWARLAIGGVGSVPVRAGEAEAILQGAPPEGARVGEAAATAAGEIEAESDALVSAAYRRHLVRVLAARALERAAAQARSANGAAR
jgi:aerobic carbon-monoxide dehydrogenase medium subunit